MSSFTNSGYLEASGSGTLTTGTPTLSILCPAFSCIGFNVGGTWNASVVWEGSPDGANWFTIPAYLANGDMIYNTSSGNNFIIPVGGWQIIRINAQAFVSGTVTVAWNADSNPNTSAQFATSKLLGEGGTKIGNDDDKLKVSAYAQDAGGTTAALRITGTNDLEVADVLDASGVQGALTITTTATAVRVGGSNLSNRKALTLTNLSAQTMYWGYTNAVTTATGTPIFINQFVEWRVGPNTTIYAIVGIGTGATRVTEGA